MNASGGTITALPGTQTSSARTLTTALDNQGAVTIASAGGMTLASASAQHLNSGTIDLVTGNPHGESDRHQSDVYQYRHRDDCTDSHMDRDCVEPSPTPVGRVQA